MFDMGDSNGAEDVVGSIANELAGPEREVECRLFECRTVASTKVAHLRSTRVGRIRNVVVREQVVERVVCESTCSITMWR